VCCFGRFGRGSAYAPVLFLQGARSECPSVSSCGPYYWGTGALLSLVIVYGRDSVCLVCLGSVCCCWCGCLGGALSARQ
jgi:hypothetical protein